MRKVPPSMLVEKIRLRALERKRSLKVGFLIVVVLSLLLGACGGPQSIVALFVSPTPTPTHTPTTTLTPTVTLTFTPTITLTPTSTFTPTITPTPTITDTPTITPSPTFDFPDVTVIMQAHCRYGPAKAYLHAGDLYEGDHGLVWNRNSNASWLWVKWDKQDWPCWVSDYVIEVEGDPFSVVEYYHPLPESTLYGPPKKVGAVREGDQVIVTWEEVWMTEDDDRGYMLKVMLCQEGRRFEWVVHTDVEQYTFKDEESCKGKSGGKLYAVEKHGYTDSVPIPWP